MAMCILVAGLLVMIGLLEVAKQMKAIARAIQTKESGHDQ